MLTNLQQLQQITYENENLKNEVNRLKRALKEYSRDDHTGLMRHEIFREIVVEQLRLLEQHPGASLSFIIIDLSDERERPSNSEIVGACAGLLKNESLLRRCDVIAHASDRSDKFLILLPELNEEGVHVVKSKLLRMFKQYRKQRSEASPVFLGAAIGSATTTARKGVSPQMGVKMYDTLYRDADLAMLAHKKDIKG